MTEDAAALARNILLHVARKSLTPPEDDIFRPLAGLDAERAATVRTVITHLLATLLHSSMCCMEQAWSQEGARNLPHAHLEFSNAAYTAAGEVLGHVGAEFGLVMGLYNQAVSLMDPASREDAQALSAAQALAALPYKFKSAVMLLDELRAASIL